MSRGYAAAAALPVLLLTLAGCGGAESDRPAAGRPEPPIAAPTTSAAGPTGAASTVDACLLLTRAEAEALVGMPLQAAVAGPSTCTYPAPPTGASGQAFVAHGPGAKKTYDIDRQLGHEFRALPGIGDEAWLEPAGSAVFVRAGTTWVVVSMVKLNDPAENAAPLRAAAATVAGRL